MTSVPGPPTARDDAMSQSHKIRPDLSELQRVDLFDLGRGPSADPLRPGGDPGCESGTATPGSRERNRRGARWGQR